MADTLRSGCEECVASLNGLITIHFGMDTPDRMIRPSDGECVYRLRKVLVHVKAITRWEFDTDVMHVIAPDLRAANEQVDEILKKLPRGYLDDLLGVQDKQTARRVQASAKKKQETVSSYIHPTPQRLLLPRDQGGLGELYEFPYWSNMFMFLFDLVLRYAMLLGYLSQLLNAGSEAAVASVMERMRTKVDSIARECFPST